LDAVRRIPRRMTPKWRHGEGQMKQLMCSVAVAMALAVGPAAAQKVDLSTIKCKEFLESGKDTIGFIMMWLDGFYTDEDAPSVVDFDAMKGKGEKLGEYCAKNPANGLITAADEIFGK
jgi:acid stress chaperone HdeB